MDISSPTVHALRRFHFGDAGAEVPPLPATVGPACGSAPASDDLVAGQRSLWPLVVDPAAGDETFATSLGSRAENELPAGAVIVPLDRAAPWRLAHLAAERRARRAAEAFAKSAAELRRSAEALLEADRVRGGGDGTAASTTTDTDRLGGLGARFVDAGQLQTLTAHRRVGSPLAAERGRALAQAHARLNQPLPVAEPIWIASPGAELAGVEAVRADDPCAQAIERFDSAAAQVAEWARAARRVALESSAAFDPERHPLALERLDWRALRSEELALVPIIFARLNAHELTGDRLVSLLTLLRSGRPIQIVLTADTTPPDLDARVTPFDPTGLGLAHRSAFVCQSSLAAPEPLVRGVLRALASGRPALWIVDLPAAAIERPAAFERYLSLRLGARSAPCFVFDPDAGGSFADRLDLTGNPAPGNDWWYEPASPGSSSSNTVPVTFADVAIADPLWRKQFSWAGETQESLSPIVDWLALPAETRELHLPFVWGQRADGSRVRLVVSRLLARATADHLAFWRDIEELAAIRSAPVERAVAAARRDIEARSTVERAALEARHGEELTAASEQAVAAAVERIVGVLLPLA